MSARDRRQSDLVAEASAWFVEFRDGDVPHVVRARFEEWLRRSPEHIQAYLEVSAAWSELPTSDPERRIDVDALVTRARASGEDNFIIPLEGAGGISPSGLPQGARRAGRLFAPNRLAASIAFAVILLGLSAWLAFFRADTYSTGVGEQRTVRLADGSTLELNALSKARVTLSKHERHIDLLQGQALFRVAKDPTRPFIVESGAARVRAVGTEFDVYRKLTGTTVTVLEGQVAILPELNQRASRAVNPAPRDQQGDPALLVSAGEQATVTPEKMSKQKGADVKAATAWVGQRLIFEATPLGEVAEEFNRYNTKKLVIADETLTSLGISGVYSTADPASLIGFLRAQPALQVTETDREIRVSHR